MTLDELLQLQALRAKSGYENQFLVDHVVAGTPDGTSGIRQMCAKVSVQLHNEVDSICARLDLSKRAFIEAAVIEACLRAQLVIERTGINDPQGSL